MGTVHQVLAVHSILFTEIWLLNISIKKQKELLAHFTQAISDIHIVKRSIKTYIFTARDEHFTTDQEIDYRYFEAFLLETLVEDKKSFFKPFFKSSLITGNEKKKVFKTFISRKGGLSSFWFTFE